MKTTTPTSPRQRDAETCHLLSRTPSSAKRLGAGNETQPRDGGTPEGHWVADIDAINGSCSGSRDVPAPTAGTTRTPTVNSGRTNMTIEADPPMNAAEIREAFRRHQAGESVRRLAESMHHSYTTIVSALCAAGWRRPHWRNAREKQDAANAAAELYKQGQSIRDIASDWRCGYGTISALLHDHGVSMRPRGGDNRRAARRPTVGHQ